MSDLPSVRMGLVKYEYIQDHVVNTFIKEIEWVDATLQ